MFIEPISGIYWQVYPQNKLIWVRTVDVGASQKLQVQRDDSTKSGVSVLDIAYLDRATLHDKPLRTEVIGLFLSQMNGVLRKLSFPLDAQSWMFLTHTLKGAAAAVGATQIAEVATIWEKRPFPQTAQARAVLAAELQGAQLAFEKAASNLH